MNGSAWLFRLLRMTAAMAAVVALFGCDSAEKSVLTNRLPEVRLTAAPIDTSGRYYYSITLNWVGFDPDGRVDHFLFTVDPHLLAPGQDTVWERTTANEVRRSFDSTSPLREQPGGRLLGADYHTFLIRAVDNKGDPGPFSVRAFNSYTIAPEVFLIAPPAQSFPFVVTPAVRISWRGEDVDGVFTQKPVKYKYILLTSSSPFPQELAFAKPDSLRRYYENHPNGAWFGWDSTSAETTMARFTNLTPNTIVVFCVIGFDEAGAYNPLFSFATNMTRLSIGFAGQHGPQIGMFNESFNYEYTLGGICSDVERCQVPVEFPAGRKITINWYAIPPAGSDIESYRWGLDIEDLFDYETKRTDELTDLSHWSTPSANVTSATVGPFNGGEIHFFYVLAEDNNTLKSMGTVRLEIVAPTFERPLLVVDDTRLKPTVYRSSRDTCPLQPSGPWPNRAEMDTFMFARGGKWWKCQGGARSQTGMFGAYDYDSIGTRTNRENLTVKLSVLAKYRHVVWMVDGEGAGNLKPGTDAVDPGVAFRYMGERGRVNTLATYVRQGGKVWLNGGGAGYAVTDPWNDRNNDGGSKKYSSVDGRNELGPGRYMFDVAKWQSSFQINKPLAVITRELGRFRGPPPSKYAALPARLETKTVATDPVATEAPDRINIYSPTVSIEYLRQDPNYIIEDIDPRPDVEQLASTLDTLYRVQATTLNNPPERNPYLPGMPTYVIMTHYAGPPPDNVSVTHSGFPIWWPKRTQAQELVDYVLGTIWGGAGSGLDKRAWPGNPPNPTAFRAASAGISTDRAVGIARPVPSRGVTVGASRPGSSRVPKD